MQGSETTEGSGKGGKKIKKKRVKKNTSKEKEERKVTIKPCKKKRRVRKDKLDRGERTEDSEENGGLLSDSDGGGPSLNPPPTSPKHLEVRSVDGSEMQVPFFSQFNLDSHEDSRNAGRELFRLLINPLPLDNFFE